MGNVFHAGDGNLHPLVLYDGRVAGQAERAQRARRADPRGLHRRRRLDHRRARRRHGQGLRDAAAVRRGRPRRDGAAAARLRPAAGSRTPARSSRRRGCAARRPGRIACTHSSARGSPTVPETLIEYEPGDLVAIAPAAMALAGAAARRSPSTGSASRSTRRASPTIGDCLTRGPLRPAAPPLRHDARPRDRRHGVLRDGTRANSGGKVVKNVAGYDLGKLLCGSRGRLGSVERVALRLHPLPACARTRHDRRLALAGAAPLADRSERRRPRRRPAARPDRGLATLRRRAVRAAARRGVGPLGGDPRAAVARCRGRRRWQAGEDAPLVRPGPAVAYTAQEPSEQWSPLAQRVAEAMWTPELIADCVHCGFCLPSCPTYALWHEEMDSPRGRIHLMGALADGSIELTDQVAEHFDRCLGCMACVTACPSGVQYGTLIEQARELVEERTRRPLADRLAAAGALRRDPAPPSPARRARAAPAARPRTAGGAEAGRAALVRAGMAARAHPGRGTERRARRGLRAERRLRRRQRGDRPGARRRGLRRPRAARAGLLRRARTRTPGGVERRHRPRPRARRRARRPRPHRHERRGLRLPPQGPRHRRTRSTSPSCWSSRARSAIRCRSRVAFQDSCHLRHAQGITAEPRAMLDSIPGLRRLEPAEQDLCCGSAGIYNIVQADAAAELGERKAARRARDRGRRVREREPGLPRAGQRRAAPPGQPAPRLPPDRAARRLDPRRRARPPARRRPADDRRRADRRGAWSSCTCWRGSSRAERARAARRAPRARRAAARRRAAGLPRGDARRCARATGACRAAPADLADRRVEITGPTDRKMVINALNSGARVFMADFEDSNSPTWENMLDGQRNLSDAIDRTIRLQTPEKTYELSDALGDAAGAPARLASRRAPLRGRRRADLGARCSTSASTCCATTRRWRRRAAARTCTCPSSSPIARRGCGTACSSRAQDELGIPRGTVRATVLIETILAAFEMDEILHALGEHATGLNAGRWDYLFSVIKKLGHRPEFVLPDRNAGRHGRAVHARLRGAARAHLPPPRRARDRRHGGVHPLAARPGGQRDRARAGARGQGARGLAGLRRHVGRASRPRAGRVRGLRPRAGRAPEPARRARATTSSPTRPRCSTSPRRRARSRWRGCATTSRSASSTSRRGCAGRARSRSTT